VGPAGAVVNRIWLHPIVWTAIVATCLVAGMHTLNGLVVLMHDMTADPLLPPVLDWPHVVAGGVWIGLFVGGIMGCLLDGVALWTARARVDVEQTQTLTTEETLVLEKWIESRQCQWEQLKRLWS
jgi:hypothetical protein